MPTYKCWYCQSEVDAEARMTIANGDKSYDVCESCYMRLPDRDTFARINSPAMLDTQARNLARKSAPLGNRARLRNMPIHGPDIVDYSAWRDRLELLLLCPDVVDTENGGAHKRIEWILSCLDTWQDGAEKQRASMRNTADRERRLREQDAQRIADAIREREDSDSRSADVAAIMARLGI